MLHHVIFSDKTFSAIITSIWFFPGVEAHVPSEVGLVVKLLRTDLALVRFVAGMLLQVFRMQVLEGESFTALITFERFVARVEALVMLSQVACPVKNFVALDALV